MPLSQIDFGNSIVPIKEDDAFFLDTNIIVAYLYEKDPKHLPIYCLITYLLKEDVMMCFSETVFVESLNTLARLLYIDDQYNQYIDSQGEPDNRRKLLKSFKNTWSSRVLKTEPEVLKHYNSLALQLMKPLLSGLLLLESKDEYIDEAMSLASDSPPLASADSMIVATSVIFGCGYIISIDGDIPRNNCGSIEILSTSVTNDHYDKTKMLSTLGIVQCLTESLGDKGFFEKFGIIPTGFSSFQIQ